MSAPPPCFHELINTVEDYINKNSRLRGWHLDATEDVPKDVFSIFPFATQKAVGLHALYNYSPYNLQLRCVWSSVGDSWRNLLPTVTRSMTINAVTHTVECKCASLKASYSATHPAFCVTWSGNLQDGGNGFTTLTTRLAEGVFAGASVGYDPKRSGVNNMTALLVRRNFPTFWNGDVMAKYTLNSGFGLHLRVPVSPVLDAGVIAESNRFIAGIQGRSPCGARMIANCNVTDGSVTLGVIRNLQDIWKMSITYTLPLIGNPNAPAAPRFGLKLSNDAMLN